MSDDLFFEYEAIEGEYECLEEEEETKSKSKKEKEKIDAIFTIDSEWGKNEKFLTLQLFVQIRGYENLLFVYYNAEQKELFETNQKNYLLTYQKRRRGRSSNSCICSMELQFYSYSSRKRRTKPNDF